MRRLVFLDMPLLAQQPCNSSICIASFGLRGWGWGSSSNQHETHDAYCTVSNKSPLPPTQESCVFCHYT